DIGQRPRRFEFDVKFAVHPERMRCAPFEQRTDVDPEADAEGAQMHFAVQLYASTDLQRRPLDRGDRREIGVEAHAERPESPGVPIADPTPGHEAVVAYDEVAVRFEKIENARAHPLVVRRFAERKTPAIRPGVQL